MKQILVIGITNIDSVAQVSHMPALAELAAADIIACQGDGPDRRYQLKA